jgi:alkanesulfonate monooxygenase SsuD/methylene tetrahydromethanopterin reductase-like flavin-dependent oxidoreductase (luciferase family)
MRIGIFDHVERREDVSAAQQFEERMQMAELYDRSGFYCYHIAEHHHSPLCLTPNQAVYLASVAQRTTNLRLATAVSVLPLHNPVRLVEEICMLDQLSGGRVEVGVGRGTDRAQELRMWGGDAAENDARFEESLDILIEGLGCEFLSHNGRFFNFKDLWMALRPAQLPRPPMWWPGSAEHAGRRGMNFISAERADIPATRAVMEQFRAAFQQSPTPELSGGPEPLYGATKRF